MHHKKCWLAIICFLLLTVSPNAQAPKWKGKIEYEDAVKVIMNPSEPFFGVLQFELKEELDFINPESKTGYFNTVRDVQVDDNGYICV